MEVVYLQVESDTLFFPTHPPTHIFSVILELIYHLNVLTNSTCTLLVLELFPYLLLGSPSTITLERTFKASKFSVGRGPANGYRGMAFPLQDQLLQSFNSFISKERTKLEIIRDLVSNNETLKLPNSAAIRMEIFVSEHGRTLGFIRLDGIVR
jgi:hypothetical protein